MSGFGKTLTWLLAIAALALIALNVWLRLSARSAQSAISDDGTLTLRQETDGELTLSWSGSPAAGRYYVQVLTLRSQASDETLLFAAESEGTELRLPRWLPQDEAVTICVESFRRFRFLGRELTRMGEGSIRAVTRLHAPKTDGLSAQVDPDADTARLTWDGWDGDRYRLFLVGDGEALTMLSEPEQTEATLHFGTKDLPVPGFGETVRLVLEPLRVSGALRFYGQPGAVTLTRNDFFGSELRLSVAEEGDNAYRLTWNETKSAGYQLLLVAPDGAARELETYAADALREYHTGHLPPYSEFTYRVIALDAPNGAGSFEVAPGETTLRTDALLTYATVWSLRDLNVYSEPVNGEKLGVMKAAASYCVTGEKDGWLQIETPSLRGYVDGDLCLIDLADYVGPLCAYDISNSYDSLYRVHDYDIPEVSGEVVDGYEHVRLAPGRYLVPLLYPTANRLIGAAEAAAADGWRLKIYDAFRPNRATRSIYDLAEKILNEPLPEEDHEGRKTPEPKDEDEEPMTYLELMTNGTYALGNFLASSSSRHNFGVALDLTLERAADRSELRMQTRMHDLSWYSVTYRNNDNANLLREYMTGAGFGVLHSEWWHFQDNDVFASGKLSGRWIGVDPKGWRLDDHGWRYRGTDGRFLTDTELEIDGALCRFGSDGYLLPQP